MTASRLLGSGAFLLGVFVLVPVFILLTGRWDFYYPLTSVALLSVAAAVAYAAWRDEATPTDELVVSAMAVGIGFALAPSRPSRGPKPGRASS